MPWYLAPFDGDGTEAPFRPRGTDGISGWAAVDLRADSTQQSGRCLLWTSQGVTGDGLVQLPEPNTADPDPGVTLPDSVADNVASALGLANSKIRGRSSRTLIAGVVTDLAADLGIKEVAPEADGVRRVRMGDAGVVWDEERDG